MRPRASFPILASSLLALAGCGGTSPDVRPPWLLELIAQIQAEPVRNPPAYIARQEYPGGVYYFVPSHCCDMWSELYDSKGALVCHPDGGITGDGDGSCPALGGLVREEIVWRDLRSP